MTTATKTLVGQKYSRHSFGKVLADNGRAITVENEAGKSWDISRDIFDDEFKLSHEFKNEVGTNRTDVIQQVRENASTVMTVCFRKKANFTKLVNLIHEVAVDDPTEMEKITTQKGEISRNKIQTLVAQLGAGDLREMTGRHFNQYDDNGRLRFIESGKGMRLIDPRTIEWVIVDGAKHVVD